jgi:hypothetical protein
MQIYTNILHDIQANARLLRGYRCHQVFSMRGRFRHSLLIAVASVEGHAMYHMSKSSDTSHCVLAIGNIRITKIHRCLWRRDL